MQRTTLAAASLLLLTACHRHEKAAVLGPPPPWLDAKVEQLAKSAAPNAERVGDFYRGLASQDNDRTDWQVMLDNQHCYFFSGSGAEYVKRFSLYLWNPADHRVIDRRPESADVLMNYCPTETGLFRLQGKVQDGVGHYSVAVYKVDAPSRPAPPPTLTLEQVIDAQASSAAPDSARAGNFFVGNGEMTEWFASMEAGQCYWVIGAGDPGVKKLWMYLWDPQGHRITENRSDTNTSMIGHCPTVGGMYKFQAKVESGGGKYEVGVYWKKR